MVRQNLILDLNRELIVDNFAGGGGASTGIENALGRHVDHAINHDAFALGMHRINHPQTVHHCEDVFEIDPLTVTEGRRVGLGWFSPDCKHFSKAKGGKPLNKKIRGLAFVILRWAKIRTRVIYMENVEEIQTWCPLLANGKADPNLKGRTWQSFLGALGEGLQPDNPDIPEMLEVLGDSVTREELVRGFGYDLETKEVKASRHGARTIRKRLFMIARCDGMPIVWPEAVFGNAKERKLNRRLLPEPMIAQGIDWTLRCPSIFLTAAAAKQQGLKVKRPLAASTKRRIATGMDRYVLRAAKPFLISLTHQGSDNRVESLDGPMSTITGAHRGEKALVNTKTAPFITEHANASNQRNMPADEPMRTLCANVKGGHLALIGATILSKHPKDKPTSVEDPIGTASTRDSFSIASATMVHTAHGEQDKHGNKRRGRGAREVTEPAHSITASPDGAIVAASLAVMTTGHSGGEPLEPLKTVATGGHHALVASTLVQTGYGEREGQAPRALDIEKPLGTVVASGKHAVVAAHLLQKGHYSSNSGMVKGANEPMRTQTANEEHAVVAATLVGAGGPTRAGEPRPIDKPLDTVLVKNDKHLAAAHMVKLRGTNVGDAATEPVHTISAAGQHHGIVAAHLTKFNTGAVGSLPTEPIGVITAGSHSEDTHGGAASVHGVVTACMLQNNGGFNRTPAREVDGPASTITGSGSQQSLVTGSLATYYGTEEDGQSLDEPGRTVTGKARHGLARAEAFTPPMTEEQINGARTVADFLREHGVVFEGEFATVKGPNGECFVIVDIGMRMLTPRELFWAQGFPDAYVIDRAWLVDPQSPEIVKEVKLTKEQQIRMCGNSVCPPVAEALVRANSYDLSVWRLSERQGAAAHSAAQRKKSNLMAA